MRECSISFDGQAYGNLETDDVVIFGDLWCNIVFDIGRTPVRDAGHYWPWNWEVAV